MAEEEVKYQEGPALDVGGSLAMGCGDLCRRGLPKSADSSFLLPLQLSRPCDLQPAVSNEDF